MQDDDESVGRETGVDSGKNLGRKLQEARAARGLTLDEIAAELRMEPKLLKALEDCRFSDLGPPVFAKGYLKQYGNRLGLDYADLLAEYYRLVEPQEISIAPSRTIKLHDERQITVWIVAALGIALLGVFLLVWWFDQPQSAREPIAPAVPTPEIEAGAGGEGQREAAADGAGAADPTDGLPGDEPPVADPADAPTEALETESSSPAAAGAPEGPVVAIEVEFVEDSWTEITDANGANLFFRLGRAGERASFTAATPVRVFLGNSAGVALTVDGRPFEVPGRRQPGDLARFSIEGPTD